MKKININVMLFTTLVIQRTAIIQLACYNFHNKFKDISKQCIILNCIDYSIQNKQPKRKCKKTICI